MSTPSTIINVRPGQASTVWSYAGASPSGGATVSAVAFDAASALGQASTRGSLQYSLDNGKNWIGYTLPVDGLGVYVNVAGTVWRFLDRAPTDSDALDSFSVHYRLADGSVVTQENTVVPDNQPVGLTGNYDILFSTMASGDVVDVLLAIDTGAATGGRWAIDSQSTPGLFAIAFDPAGDGSARLVVANASLLPASGGTAAATIHYYDRYQVDAGGNPLPNTGVARTLTYNVQDGSTRDLAGFTDEVKIGAGHDSESAAPVLAQLSTGGFVAVWQGEGSGLWAQVRDAGGNALAAAYALTPHGEVAVEGQPAVTALAGGRFVVAYSVNEGGADKIAYRVVEANGNAGVEHVLDAGFSGDAAMPALTTLADGSVAIAWRSGGVVHVQAVAADGSLVGGQQVAGALGSAYNPDVAALAGGGYVLTWGELGDGNVYAALESLGGIGAAFVASADGYAASITTAAPLAHVAALAGGGFVLAWDSYLSDPHGFSISDIYFQRFDAGGHALGGITQANVQSGGGRYDAAVAALSDGSFILTWQGADGDGDGIYGRRFGLDGSALDQQEFAVSQGRAGSQTGADVAALAGGGFVSAWVDTAGSGAVGVELRVLAGQPDGGAHGASSPSTGKLSGAGGGSSAAVDGGYIAGLVGNAGNNMLGVAAGHVTLDGGAGVDTAVIAGARAGFTVAREGTGFGVSDAWGDHAQLDNIERVQFSDAMVALDIDGNGGQAYRLYQAAFNRTPDAAGVGYWIDMLDHGETLLGAARGFIASQEFAATYGNNVADAQFVQALYQNVLHRPAEGAGFDYWMGALQSSARAQVLVEFSESGENQAQVIGTIQNGFDYTHWITG